MRDVLKTILASAKTIPPEELPRLLGDLEEVRATALARLTAPQPAQPPADELIGVAEAARRLGISEHHLYHHHKDFPFTRRLGHKLLFSAQGIEKRISHKLRT